MALLPEKEDNKHRKNVGPYRKTVAKELENEKEGEGIEGEERYEVSESERVEEDRNEGGNVLLVVVGGC